MKKLYAIFMMIMIVFVIGFTTTSCKKTDTGCSGMGTLSLSNQSNSTTQQIMIDGASYGKLYPGQSKDISLAAGTHTWQLVGLSGGNGCTQASVIIVECQSTGFYCDGKKQGSK
jgi:hypothetical protein